MYDIRVIPHKIFGKAIEIPITQSHLNRIYLDHKDPEHPQTYLLINDLTFRRGVAAIIMNSPGGELPISRDGGLSVHQLKDDNDALQALMFLKGEFYPMGDSRYNERLRIRLTSYERMDRPPHGSLITLDASEFMLKALEHLQKDSRFSFVDLIPGVKETILKLTQTPVGV